MVARASPERTLVGIPCMRWLRLVLPAGSVIANIETERGGTAATRKQRMRYGQKRKASGVVTGFPDAVAAIPGGRTIWFEWKRPVGGILSEPQQDVHDDLREIGHVVIVCTGLESARYGLQGAGIPLREAAGQAVALPVVRRAKRRVAALHDKVPEL